ncbi:TolC family outer membrane protein [Rhodospirillaceae bacterium SYSU D60014]|uniref:TolC family outer membrane protein n=1 Tax=Virgifigura deserti TaxID=2268457 RepID=UPI000E664EF9
MRRFYGAVGRLAAGAVAVVIAVQGGVGAASAETLVDALAKAYQNNPTLLAGRAELRARDELVAQALSGWRPTVTLNGEVGREWQESSPGGSETLTPRSANLNLNQPLYRGGRTVAATDQAENLVLSQRAQLASVEQNVLLNTVAAYMDVVRDQAVLQLTINNEQVLQRQLQAARDRFEVGEITRTDVSQSESRLALATANRIQAEGNLTASRAAYRELVGDMPGTLEAPELLLTLPATQDEAIAGSVQNPAVLAAIFAEKAAVEGADVVFGELLPQLSLNGDLTTGEDLSFEGVRTDGASVTAQLVVPLYQGGEVTSRLREAKQIASQRRLQIIEARRNAARQATTAWEALQTAIAQIESFQAQARAADIALEGVRQEAQVGARTILDVLDAEQEALDAQVNVVTAQRDRVVAGFQVLAAVGQLTAPDLDLPVSYYDVDEHYFEVRDKWYGLGAPIE